MNDKSKDAVKSTFEEDFGLNWNSSSTQRGHLSNMDKANIAVQKAASGKNNKDILISVLGKERYETICKTSKYFREYPGSLMNNIKKWATSEYARAVQISQDGGNPLEDEVIKTLADGGVFKRKAAK